MFYSKSTGGFYSPEIHTIMPSDVVEITDEQHQALLETQSQGKVIVSDDNGYPVAVIPTVTPEQLKQQRIRELKGLLSASDYKMLSDYQATKTQAENDAIIEKRALWRDEVRVLENEINIST